MTTVELNTDVVRRYVSAFNQGDMDTPRVLFTPDAVIHGVVGASQARQLGLR